MDFIDCLATHGDAPALLFPGTSPISYAELDRRVAAAASGLGAGKKLVLVEAEPSEHGVIAYLAALRGRHAVALLPPGDRNTIEEFELEFAPDVVCRRVDGRWRTIVGTGAREPPPSGPRLAAPHVGQHGHKPFR